MANIDERKEPEEEDQSLSVSVPYVQGFSETFQTIMKNESIKVVFMKGRTLENELCNLKPPKGKMERENVVYMVDCKVCGEKYIGETAQRFAIDLINIRGVSIVRTCTLKSHWGGNIKIEVLQQCTGRE